MIEYDTERALARIESITSIEPIPDADAIEAARIGGWTVVVKKGEFQPGDQVVYFEIDTCLPLDDERFAFLAPRGCKMIDGVGYHVLKTARLRGTYSQGLALPAGQFGDLEDLRFGKWDPPLPTGPGDITGSFPDRYARKTDSERAQNLTNAWPQIAAHPGGWQATEKVDGTSCTVVCDADGGVHVAGRQWKIGDGNNTYWNALRATFDGGLPPLSPGEGFQCEVVGPGVQDNRLGLPKLRVLVFNVIRNRQALPRAEWPEWATANAVPLVPLPFPASPADAVTQVDGLKSLVSPGRNAEGVVWHTLDGQVVPELGRETFKAISNRYLLKSGS